MGEPTQMRYVLDTSFLIDYLRGVPAAVARFALLFESAETPVVNEIALCEVATGARPGGERDLAALVEPLEFVQPGPESALEAARWRREARALGSTLSLPDALIAACAVSLDAAVLTRNVRDFALTPARIETY
jgi:predicted nucleic acid-binding protein